MVLSWSTSDKHKVKDTKNLLYLSIITVKTFRNFKSKFNLQIGIFLETIFADGLAFNTSALTPGVSGSTETHHLANCTQDQKM